VVVEYIRYTIEDARAQAFEQAYRRSGEALRASLHCEQYEVSRRTEDPTQSWFVSNGTPRRGT
jgi:hemoglobin